MIDLAIPLGFLLLTVSDGRSDYKWLDEQICESLNRVRQLFNRGLHLEVYQSMGVCSSIVDLSSSVIHVVETQTPPNMVATIRLQQLTSTRRRKDPTYRYQRQQWPCVIVPIASVLLTMVFLVRTVLLSRQIKIPAFSLSKF